MAAPLFFLLPSSLSLPKPNPKSHLSFLSSSSSSSNPLHFLSTLTFNKTLTLTLPPIRMGGGPRTFPGGVSKWQWKRMQSKKSKQLLKARLLRERQIYEMRKRAELKAAVSELEKPWEMVERVAPNLFSVSADDQVKALADRFQRPGGFDMWSHRDGPQMFRRVEDGTNTLLPSARFFPKGVVHSIKPYGPVGSSDGSSSGDDAPQVFDDWIARGGGGVSSRRRRRRSDPRSISPAADAVDVEVLGGSEVEDVECKGVVRRNANGYANKGRRNGNSGLRPTDNLYHGGDRNQRMGMDATRKSHQGDRRLRGHSADPLDVERTEDRSGEGQGRHLDQSNAADRRKYGMINRWQRVDRNDKLNLRPTSDLHNVGGNKQMGDSRWNMEGNGVRRSNRTSK